jgi:hypothetical protein
MLVHAGFSDIGYAYCDACGKTAMLSFWDKRMPKLSNCPGQQEICAALEPFLTPCSCGGAFKWGSGPRSPHCKMQLSADLAMLYLEANAPGTRKAAELERYLLHRY